MSNIDKEENSYLSEGYIDGKSVYYHYAPEREKLEYRLAGENKSEAQFFMTKDIIGIIPRKLKHQESKHQLLYVKKTSDSDNIGIFQSAIVKNVPSPFAKKYSLASCPNIGEAETTLIHVIVSVASGNQQAEACFASLVEPLLAHLKLSTPIESTIVRTITASTISDYTTRTVLPQANNGRKQTIVLLSGDGGVVDLINSLALRSSSLATYREPEIAVIPVGTANALAHSLHIADDNTVGLSNWIRGSSISLPMFTTRFSSGASLVTDEGTRTEPLPKDRSGDSAIYGSVVCSWGLHASLVADSDNKEFRKLGSSRFEKAANALLHPPGEVGPHRYKATVSMLISDESGMSSWERLPHGEHAYVLVTLVSNLEKTFKISPDTKPLDGRLRLVYIEPTSGDEITKLMSLAYENGKHVENPGVLYKEIEGLRIEFEGREHDPRWRRICVDGKIIIAEEHGWVEVVKSSEPNAKIIIVD